MEEIIIACEKIDCPRAFHRLLAEKLAFPEWYGGNLDALYDCLTSISKPTSLRLTGFDRLASYSRGFRRVMEEAAEDNPNLRVVFC